MYFEFNNATVIQSGNEYAASQNSSGYMVTQLCTDPRREVERKVVDSNKNEWHRWAEGGVR